MRDKFFLAVGTLLVVAAIVGFVHPQWQGRDKIMEVDVAGKQLQVTTRRVTDVPPIFSGAILVAGLCTAALGAVGRAKSRRP